jgi:hypothetical protein
MVVNGFAGITMAVRAKVAARDLRVRLLAADFRVELDPTAHDALAGRPALVEQVLAGLWQHGLVGTGELATVACQLRGRDRAGTRAGLSGVSKSRVAQLRLFGACRSMAVSGDGVSGSPGRSRADLARVYAIPRGMTSCGT